MIDEYICTVASRQPTKKALLVIVVAALLFCKHFEPGHGACHAQGLRELLRHHDATPGGGGSNSWIVYVMMRQR